MTSKEKFLKIANTIERPGIKGFLDYLEKTDFYIAPASTRFHDSYEGGLIDHSLSVYQHLKKLVKLYKLDISEESIVIVSLFHDVCKINCYKKEPRWKKDEQNNWEKYYTYTFNEQEKYGGHGSKSVFILQNYMKLTFEEATAINCHMGPNSTDFSCMDAYRENPLAFLLHTADMASTVTQLNTLITE